MGRVDAAAHPGAIEIPLPWGPIVRGLRWSAGADSVLLLHEPGADLDSWGVLPARLAQTLGMQAIAIDLPGHGLSDDPWEVGRTTELVRLLIEPRAAPRVSDSSPGPTGDNGASQGDAGRRFVIAAGSVASVVLELAASLHLAGLVLLSPSTSATRASDASNAAPPSPGSTGEGGRGVRANVPKLLFAGSHADADLETARRLASSSGGWSAVTSVPVSERGTRLLATPWHGRIGEEIVAFLRDCQHRVPGVSPGPRMSPPRTG